MKNKLFSFLLPVFIILIGHNLTSHNSYQKKSLLAIPISTPSSETITAITYNIRYDNPRDELNNWQYRKTHLAEFIQSKNPDILGVQEALYHQTTELEELLSAYSHIGVGRDDGATKGEFSPIFYKKDKFNIIKTGTFWLSETPEIIGSKGWDAALPRIGTWAILENRLTFKRYFILNTHFDHRGEQARNESAKLLIQKAKSLGEGLPALIMGDFNATPDSKVFKTMTSSGFQSSKSVSQQVKGRTGTFNGFKMEHDEYRIDYIFVNQRVKVKSYEVATPQYNGRQASDHYPVVVEMEI